MPQADRALLYADALSVSYRWLISGEGPKQAVNVSLDQDQWTLLPRYDLDAFRGRDASGRIEFPPVLEMVPVRRADLARLSLTRSEQWLVEMPTGVLPSVASPGELVICEDRGIAFRDRRIVILSIGDDPTIVRRVVRAADGTTQLLADDPAVPAIHADRLAEGFNRFGDILGAIRVTRIDT